MGGDLPITKVAEKDDATKILADGGESLLNRILVALANEERRYLIYYLVNTDVATIEECTTAVAVRKTKRHPKTFL